MGVELNRIAVSPSFTAQKLENPGIEDKIDVFEDQVNGWVLSHAKVLASEKNPYRRHCGIAVLMIAGSYFESLASFLRGESSDGKSKQFFAIGLQNVFPDILKAAGEEKTADPDKVFSDFAGTFYAELRCGLFHEAMIRGRIFIAPASELVGNTGLAAVIDTRAHKLATIVIDPERFLSHVANHFADYVQKLRDPSQVELRRNFEAAWDGRLTRPHAVVFEEWFSEIPEK
jgi:hypothetical protein